MCLGFVKAMKELDVHQRLIEEMGTDDTMSEGEADDNPDEVRQSLQALFFLFFFSPIFHEFLSPLRSVQIREETEFFLRVGVGPLERVKNSQKQTEIINFSHTCYDQEQFLL